MEMTDMIFEPFDDIEKVKNRQNKSKLSIFSLHPELFLSTSVAHPNEVKTLILNLYFDDEYDENMKILIWEHYKKCNVEKCSTSIGDTRCCDIVNFHNLEVFKAKDLELSSELWLQFIENSEHLKEIIFSSSGLGYRADNFWFEDRIEILDALFKIPTLEKVKMEWIQLYYFPPGPSNIRHLELECVMAEDEDLRKFTNSWKTNFVTHQNLKSLILKYRSPSPYDLKDLQLDKMTQLEEVVLQGWTFECVESILMLPNLKRFEFSTWYNETDPLMKTFIKNPELKFESVERITIKVTNSPPRLDFSDTHKYLATVLNRQCLNLRSFTFYFDSNSICTSLS
jgi:hypothetical protein